MCSEFGNVIGALLVGFLSIRFGRNMFLKLIRLVYIIGFLIILIDPSFVNLSLARMLLGI